MRDLKRFFIPRFLAALLSVGIACPPAHLAIQPGRAAHALRPTQEGTGLEELRKTLTQNSAVLEPIFSRARREKISRVIFYVPSERLSWPLLDSWVILQRLEQNFPNARIEVYAPNTDLFKTVQLGSGVEIHSDLPAEDSNGDPGTVTIVAGINPLFIPNSGYVLHITSGGVFCTSMV